MPPKQKKKRAKATAMVELESIALAIWKDDINALCDHIERHDIFDKAEFLDEVDEFLILCSDEYYLLVAWLGVIAWKLRRECLLANTRGRRGGGGGGAVILRGTLDEEDRQELLSRWTDSTVGFIPTDYSRDKSVAKEWRKDERPAGVVQLYDLDSALLVVRQALKYKVSFVIATGYSTSWSLIGRHGFILDTRQWEGFTLHLDKQEAYVEGGVSMAQLQHALKDTGYFAAVAKGSDVGVIPFYISGGICSFTPIISYACENIISATVLTASGRHVEASDQENPDLLWAIRGAGQFFGLVVSLRIRIHPVTLLGRPAGSKKAVWQRVSHAITNTAGQKTLEKITNLASELSSNTEAFNGTIRLAITDEFSVPLLSKMAFFSQECLNCHAHHKHPRSRHTRVRIPSSSPDYPIDFAIAPLLSKLSKDAITSLLDFEHYSAGDTPQDQYANGKPLKLKPYQRQLQIGFDCPDDDLCAAEPKKGPIDLIMLRRLREAHVWLRQNCTTDTIASFNFHWHTPIDHASLAQARLPVRRGNTSFGAENIRTWLIIQVSWYSREEDKFIKIFFNMAYAAATARKKGRYQVYTGTDRESPIENRYRGAERLSRLKHLKRVWDPDGVFGRTFLDETSRSVTPDWQQVKDEIRRTTEERLRMQEDEWDDRRAEKRAEIEAEERQRLVEREAAEAAEMEERLARERGDIDGADDAWEEAISTTRTASFEDENHAGNGVDLDYVANSDVDMANISREVSSNGTQPSTYGSQQTETSLSFEAEYYAGPRGMRLRSWTRKQQT